MSEIRRTDATAFEAGKTYATRSACDHDCIYRVKVVRRSARSVWAEVHGKTVRRAIQTYDGRESFYPFGRYSMAAVITPDKEAIGG